MPGRSRKIFPQASPTMGGAASVGRSSGGRPGSIFNRGGSVHDRKSVSNLLKGDRSLRKPFVANKRARKVNPIEARKLKRR